MASKKAKTVIVTIAEMSGTPREFEVKAGTLLGTALRQAGYAEPAKLKANLRVNNREVALTYKVKKGDLITLAPNVAGGVA